MSREAMKLALEALEQIHPGNLTPMAEEAWNKAIAVLRQALDTEREWVGLTDEEIQDLSYLSQKIDASNAAWFDRSGFARAVEQALKEKNQ